MRSFRLRLAVISVLVSGLALLAFGVVGWLTFQRARLADLDRELRNFGFRVAGRAGPNVNGPRTETNMAEIFGLEKVGSRFFTLILKDGSARHQTGSWPESLDPASFTAGEAPMDPQPELVEPPPRTGNERREGRQDAPPPRTVLEPRYYSVSADSRRYRIGVFANPEVRLVLGADLDQFARDVSQIKTAFVIALPGALLLIALGAVFVARRALRPIEALSERMETISAEGLDQRLEVAKADVEFRRIIGAYNAMMERLEKSFHQATRFSADASHELKTPLAVMQGTLERALTKCPDGSGEQKIYSDLLQEVGNQRAILESLLLLSRADAGELQLSREKVNLSELVKTLVEDAGMLAEEKNISVRSEIQAGVEVDADAALLQQVIHNLFSNAVKYNREGGVLECRLTGEGGVVEFAVANTGDPIAAGEREKIFERFYRSSHGRESGVEGVGLGLSLAREIVAAHGGEIFVKEGDGSEPMTTFCVRLKK